MSARQATPTAAAAESFKVTRMKRILAISFCLVLCLLTFVGCGKDGGEEKDPSGLASAKERLSGKYYKTFSFFAGATKENGYTPTVPYTITVSENPYSFDEENWAVMYVTSAGADGPRPIKLRKKPSTGQWFLNDIQCLADIRTPANADPWA